MKRLYLSLVSGIGAALASTAPAQAQSTDEIEISLPEQDLPTSLREVARRSGRSILASSVLVKGRKAPAIAGTFSTEEVVRRLLEGSGLEIAHVGAALVVVAAGGGESPEAIPADASSSEPDGTIVVTGTHLRAAPATSSTVVIGRGEIDRSGATSVEGLMRKLPQNSQAGVNQETFGLQLPDQAITDHGAGLNLRGLGQRATLVLLDGRRLAPSGQGAYVDVSLIPLSLVERVDVLTDGASAIYGSDAVGGVVNIVLRDHLDGLETGLQAGVATRGGGEQVRVSLAGGSDWTGGHGLLAFEFRQEDPILARQRSFPLGLRPDTFLLPRERRHSVLASMEQDLAPTVSLSATATYARRTTERTYFPSTASLPVGTHAKADALTLSGEITVDVAHGWRLGLKSSFGLSASDQRQTQPGGANVVNARDVRNAVLGGGIQADGPLFALPAGDLRLALGAELRRETYRDGFESSAIARAVKRSHRAVRSLFAEAAMPIVSAANRMPGAERIELSAAGRFDDYGATGTGFDPKLGVLWSPIRGLALRASYGTSFRAPLLGELDGTYDVFLAPAFLIYKDPAQAAPGSITAILQGTDPAIRSESSRTWTAGAELSDLLAPGLSLSLQYYAVRFSDRIALPAPSVVVVGDPAFEPIIDHSPDLAELTAIIEAARRSFDVTGPGFSDGGATPADVDVVLDTRVTNSAKTVTDGLDLLVSYAFEAGGNRFVLDANVNRVLSFDSQLTPASPVAQALDRPFGPVRWRGRGGVGWSRGSWAGSASVNYTGGYVDDRGVDRIAVDSWTTVDLSLAYDFAAPAVLRGSRVSLHAENLFDAAPPRLLPGPGVTTGLGYDPVNASARGRFVSIQLRRTW